MAPVARALSSSTGILEPIQTAVTLQGQIDELKTVLETRGQLPLTLLGYSWGAWLCYLLATQIPHLLSRLILVSSPPFDEEYTRQLSKTRFDRLSPSEQAEFSAVVASLSRPDSPGRDASLARLGALAAKTDY